MERRALVALPGLAAFAASRVFADTRVSETGIPPTISRKALVKQSGSKSSYKVPRSVAKQTKYVNSLAAFLNLTTAQKQQTAAIVASAASSATQIHANLKTARKALRTAVTDNDTVGMSQAAATLGTLTTQHINNGALAHAAIYAGLTAEQQAKMSQLLG
jgi:hypothetical protein